MKEIERKEEIKALPAGSYIMILSRYRSTDPYFPDGLAIYKTCIPKIPEYMESGAKPHDISLDMVKVMLPAESKLADIYNAFGEEEIARYVCGWSAYFHEGTFKDLGIEGVDSPCTTWLLDEDEILRHVVATCI